MAAEAEKLVFIVDDDPTLRTLVERWLQLAGFESSTFSDGDSCLQALTEELPAVILLDVNMPGMDGMEVLERIRTHNPLVPVIMLTADDAVESVVKAMKMGAWDYLAKPLDRTKLLTTLRNAEERYQLNGRVAQLEREVQGRGYAGIVGTSAPMQHIFRQLDRLSRSDVSVLIHGESGTGKELVARALHTSGTRSKGPFVAVNSAAIPESLMESELFGHEKGSFTGALNRRIGRFEEANNGTIFLDEIGELSPAVQAKLLRVLQERKFQRVGGSALISTDFRLVTATHRNLANDVEAGTFRQDLYFRLAVFDLEIPRCASVARIFRRWPRRSSANTGRRAAPLRKPFRHRPCRPCWATRGLGMCASCRT
jgi:DNA-binding NtrC family response regulator